MSKLKLIWDFRGPEALKIAEHHEIHLKDYLKMTDGGKKETGVQQLSNMHSIAYMIVTESEMKPIRDALKPHRGQVA